MEPTKKSRPSPLREQIRQHPGEIDRWQGRGTARQAHDPVARTLRQLERDVEVTMARGDHEALREDYGTLRATREALREAAETLRYAREAVAQYREPQGRGLGESNNSQEDTYVK